MPRPVLAGFLFHLSLTLQDQMDRTKLRFDKYGKQGLLCGAEGLPHLITDGRASHAGVIAAATDAGKFIPLAILLILYLDFLLEDHE